MAERAFKRGAGSQDESAGSSDRFDRLRAIFEAFEAHEDAGSKARDHEVARFILPDLVDLAADHPGPFAETCLAVHRILRLRSVLGPE